MTRSLYTCRRRASTFLDSLAAFGALSAFGSLGAALFGAASFPAFGSFAMVDLYGVPLRSLVQGFAGCFGDANTTRRRARSFYFVADPRRGSARSENHDVRNRNPAFFLGDPALDLLGWIGPGVSLVHRNALPEHPFFGTANRKSAAGLLLCMPAGDFHLLS